MKTISLMTASFLTIAWAGCAIGQVASPAQQAAGSNAEETETGLQEIIVTAERRPNSLQKTAIAITAMSGDQLQQAGVVNIGDVARMVPTLKITNAAGPYWIYSMRGIYSASTNQFADSGVAFSLDGVVLARPFAANGMFYDLERVEVLKGPQGTLYGRNSAVGAINILTKAPGDRLEGDVMVEAGNYNLKHATGGLTVPLGESTSVRIGFNAIRRDGFYSDGSGDEKGTAVRATLRHDFSPNVRLVLRGDFAHQGGAGQGSTGILASGQYAGDPRTSAVDQPFLANCPITDRLFTVPGCQPNTVLITDRYQNNDFKGLSAQLDVTTGLGTITTVVGYRGSKIDSLSTMTGYFIKEQSDSEQYSFESRITSPSDGALKYVLGLFAMSDKSKGEAQFEFQSQNRVNQQFYDHDNLSWAVFGQLTYALADSVRLTGGLRYTYDRKSANDAANVLAYYRPGAAPAYSGPPVPCPAGTTLLASGACNSFVIVDERTWRNLSYRAGFEWDAGPRSMIYGNVSTGYRAGGYFFGTPDLHSYEPERVTAFTLGSKNEFFGRRLRINAEAFYQKFKGQQFGGLITQRVLPNGGTTFVGQTLNIARSEAYGVELEAQWLATKTTTLSLQAQYLEATIKDFTFSSPNPGFLAPPAFGCAISPPPIAPAGTNYLVNCSGKPQLLAPQWTLHGGLSQQLPLANGAMIVGDADVSYSSSQLTSPSFLAQTRIGGYALLNLRLSYETPSKAVRVTAFMDNVTNRAVPTSILPAFGYVDLPAPNGGAHYFLGVMGPPRQYGVRLSAKF